VRLMSPSDVGCMDEKELETYSQAISEAGLAGVHAVQRMLDADHAWIKFIHGGNPRFHEMVWRTYGELLARGVTLRVDPLGQWGDGVVATEDAELCSIRAGDEAAMFVRLPLAPVVKRGALGDVEERVSGAQVRVDWAAGEVEVFVPLSAAEPGATPKELYSLSHLVTSRRPKGMVEQLQDAGIGVPPTLRRLSGKLDTLGDWYWSSDETLTDPVREYLMADKTWVREPIPDHLVISSCGRGAVTVRCVIGRVAIHMQVGDRDRHGERGDRSDAAVARGGCARGGKRGEHLERRGTRSRRGASLRTAA
jgi:hypothetical protein